MVRGCVWRSIARANALVIGWLVECISCQAALQQKGGGASILNTLDTYAVRRTPYAVLVCRGSRPNS